MPAEGKSERLVAKVIRAGRVSAWIVAISFLVASLWYFLLSQQISVADEPTFAPNVPFAQTLERFYDWYVTTLMQERVVILINIVGFLALIGVVLSLGEVLGRERPGTAVAAAVAILGSLLWIVGNTIQVGGHRAVEIMARGGNALDPVNAISFTIDRIDDWFELLGLGMIGLGGLALGIEALHTRLLSKALGYYTVGLGGILIVVSLAYVFDNGDLVDLLSLIAGLVLVPIWGVWVASLLSTKLRGIPSVTEVSATDAYS